VLSFAGSSAPHCDGHHRIRLEEQGTVANIKSQKKRILTNEKARMRNKAVKSALKTATKKVDAAVAAGDKEAALDAARQATRALDKAASAGVIHKNQAANRKSGLMKAADAV
jgi:small subunit ribosomal protein S20